jgi:zinc metalloprotease ZmpA
MVFSVSIEKILLQFVAKKAENLSEQLVTKNTVYFYRYPKGSHTKETELNIHYSERFAMKFRKSTLAVAVFVACNTGIAVSATGNSGSEMKSAAVSRALSLMHNVTAKSTGIGSNEAFVAKDVIIDNDGAEHVRFDRVSKGLRVIGGDMVVHMDSDGSLRDLSHHGVAAKSSAAGVSITGTPSIEVGEGAEDAALDHAASLFKGAFTAEPTAEKVFYARDREPVLAFDVLIQGVRRDGTPTEMHYIVDANTNALLDKFDGVRSFIPEGRTQGSAFTDAIRVNNLLAYGLTVDVEGLTSDVGITGFDTPSSPSVAVIAKAAAAGTGNSLLAGTVSLTTDSISGGYALRDPSRGNHYATNMSNRTSGNGTLFTDVDNVWGNGSTSSTVTAAVDAVFGQNKTWDYYKNVLGRNGIANDGRGAFSRIHYSTNYVNAFWSDQCFCMSYGDGQAPTYLPLVAIDVAGHEMTHGVTSRSANLTYSGESGGLNEAISDMIGTAVEFYSNNAQNTPNYLIGERIYASNKGKATPTTALRYMFKPSIDGRSPDCYTSTIGNLDVHYSSGVANHFFYLASVGAAVPAGFNLTPSQLVCNGNTSITGIGRDNVAKIVYRALTVYMTSSTNYKGARTATLNAARDLFGSTSSQYAGIAAAWSAVGVN